MPHQGGQQDLLGAVAADRRCTPTTLRCTTRGTYVESMGCKGKARETTTVRGSPGRSRLLARRHGSDDPLASLPMWTSPT